MQEYDDYKIEPGKMGKHPWQRPGAPTHVLEPRRKFSERLFFNECAAYERFLKSQCTAVPKYYGSYSMCPDRSEEPWVKVLALEFVEGKSLETVIDELVEKGASIEETENPTQEERDKFQEIADTISHFLDNGYESLDQIHAANIVHFNCKPHEGISSHCVLMLTIYRFFGR